MKSFAKKSMLCKKVDRIVLDNENVEKLLDVIKNLKQKHIVIAISHDKRLVSISDCVYDR